MVRRYWKKSAKLLRCVGGRKAAAAKKVQSEGKEGLVKLHIKTCDRIKVAGTSTWWENSEIEKRTLTERNGEGRVILRKKGNGEEENEI